ncbi:hypothetical protein SISSUDRAFT_980977 [Sistotremastrum suecicum HHB10207 ss-3]|uniref:Trs120-domain-containing protein n=1 Tax=Sistotremastrum suecicum HHB10207 ss-3 TaxID=1314776 RepID=A0A166GVN2_9AGAM|nr:hypothetical protein SISSUDRAFT_980977 [Sistotremastrum suecicum HHB10207 ss-3]
MESTPYASLGCIRVLLVPVGSIRRATFQKWSEIIKSFEHVRLGDIPPDGREDKARFMPAVLAPGHIHLSFQSHPPPQWYYSLSLFRPSEFPLGVIGIADASSADSVSSVLAEFNASLKTLIPQDSFFPLATNLFAFEEEDGTASMEIGGSLPGAVVIPSVMGHKSIYIGTLIAELCSRILSGFSDLTQSLEVEAALESLNTTLFPAFPYTVSSPVEERSIPMNPQQDGLKIIVDPPRPPSAPINPSTLRPLAPSPLNITRSASTPNRQSTLTVNTTNNKNRNSGLNQLLSHGRLYKTLGDLFLLAGRTSDASIWYNQAVPLLKSVADDVWHASALEGLCIITVLDAWNVEAGTGSTSNSNEHWNSLSEKLDLASSLYGKAYPNSEMEATLLTLLYTDSVLRHTQLLFAIWAGKGWGSSAFQTMLNGKLPPIFKASAPSEADMFRMSAITNISRSQISTILARAHGPFIMHLKHHDRIRVLSSQNLIYRCLGYKRKEAFLLRETLSVVMDLIVSGRRTSRTPNPKTPLTGLGISSAQTGTTFEGYGTIGIRELENVEGNQSILSMVHYLCGIHGVDLQAVKILAGDEEVHHANGSTNVEANDLPVERPPYGWGELQVGVIREAVAIAQELPDHTAIAQFSLSALKLYTNHFSPEEQHQFYMSSQRALTTARRRGEDRKVEYWSGNPILSLEITSLPFVRMPVERISIASISSSTSTVARVDPFIYNPRTKSTSSQALAVQNEPIEIVLTLYNPFPFDFELQSLSLRTTGVSFHSQPVTLQLPPASVHVTQLSGTPLEDGILTIHGCLIQCLHGAPREFVLELPTDAKETDASRRTSGQQFDLERVKYSGLEARPREKDKRRSGAPVPNAKPVVNGVHASGRFLRCTVVPEQPLVQIRRTSLNHGAVMLYEGESSIIRLTFENISAIPVDFIDLTFDDSTITATREALSDGSLSTFDAHEAENSLINRPVFQWEPNNAPAGMDPGQKITMSVTCTGKLGCTSGTVTVAYARTQKRNSSKESFFTRQIVLPVLVTVYHILECQAMNIVPYSGFDAPELQKLDQADSEYLTRLQEVEDPHAWCLFVMDVRNVYGSPFEVVIERNQNGASPAIVTETISPGATRRLVIPLLRLSLPSHEISKPIPSLLERQFVVTRSDLTAEQETLQRELFWHREALLKCLKAHWREASGTRTGLLDLRRQRLSLPMMEALRSSNLLIQFSVTDKPDIPDQVLKWSHRKAEAQPDIFSYLRIRVINASLKSSLLWLSLTLEPHDYVTFGGVLSDIPLGLVERGGTHGVEVPVCFLSSGTFHIGASVRGKDPNSESYSSSLTVVVHASP